MKGQVSVMKMFGCKAFRQFVRRYTSTCVYARERDFPKEIVVYMLLVFSYSKIIKLLGSNKSNYGSDYRVMSIPWILVLYKKRKRIAEAVSFSLLVLLLRRSAGKREDQEYVGDRPTPRHE